MLLAFTELIEAKPGSESALLTYWWTSKNKSQISGAINKRITGLAT